MPKTTPSRIARSLCVLIPVLGLLGAHPSEAESANRAPVVACASLKGLSFDNFVIGSADPVPAAAGLPAYCRVRATERGTQHDVEVRLPESWLGRYVQQGGGGFDGVIPPVSQGAVALQRGAVDAANNGGHRDSSGADLLNNPRAVERYAHGAILTATRFGKAVTRAYYGQWPAYSYYAGCSNGGRGALNAAAKYGAEFDGIVAAAPTINLVGQTARWTSAAALQMPSREQFTKIHALAVAKCDALDNLSDGIISNWQACTFDPDKDIPDSVGLTPAQRATVKNLLSDFDDGAGNVLYPAYGFGDLGLGAPGFPMFGTGQMRYIVLNDASWTPASFDLHEFLPKMSAVMETQYQFNADIPGLVQFMKAGGKIIIWHGADDPLISHRDTLRLWQRLKEGSGAQLSADGARLYIAPGVGHCSGGDGADTIDLLTPLMAWVEQRRAPQSIIASKLDAHSGAVRFSRPLCEYPGYPRYRGAGDPNDPANFTCTEAR